MQAELALKLDKKHLSSASKLPILVLFLGSIFSFQVLEGVLIENFAKFLVFLYVASSKCIS